MGRIEAYIKPLDDEDIKSSLLQSTFAPSSNRLQQTIAAYLSVLEESSERACAFAL